MTKEIEFEESINEAAKILPIGNRKKWLEQEVKKNKYLCLAIWKIGYLAGMHRVLKLQKEIKDERIPK